MKIRLYILLYFFFLCVSGLQAQKINDKMFNKGISSLFINEESLSLKFSYSNKKMRKEASTESYIRSYLSYKQNDTWDSIPVELRARGNFRRTNCYFPPIKLKIKSSISKGTLFEGYKKMKVVLPCMLQKRSNDDVLKEYLAYKLYEPISPAHFKTRLVALEFTDDPRKKEADDPLASIFMEFRKRNLSTQNDSVFARRKPRTYQMKAILIEDIKNVAQRNEAKVLDRFVHPLAQNAVAATRNAFFQYMIGNTDFSTAYGHNQKLLFQNSKATPLPYDFDMSGLVDASYAVVSNINNQELPITDVTQRLYRGFKRDHRIAQQVRSEFLSQKEQLLGVVENHKALFEDVKTYHKTKKYVLSFFSVLENDEKFRAEILLPARTQ